MMTQIDAWLYFLQYFDEEILKNILSDELPRDECMKNYFLSIIQKTLNNLKNSDNNSLAIFYRQCANCFCDNHRKLGFTFVGNVTKDYFDMVIDFDQDGVVTLFTDCSEIKPFDLIIGKNDQLSVDDYL